MAAEAARLPSGTVTFVVTDIEGSTRLLGQHPDLYPDLLDDHRNLLRRNWSEHHGREVDSQGDGSLVAFASADDAVVACAAAQRDLARRRWPGGLRPRVRMGVHSGVATPVGERYISVAVHQATRVSQAAHGGQVLVSDQAASGVSTVALLPLGRFRVRDFELPTPLYQLAAAPSPADEAHPEPAFPPPRCLPAERHNLPARTTRLIGRTRELDRLTSLLAGTRLITLVGAAGVGKTRLASELADSVATTWPDGVWLVDCAPIEDGALLPAAIAAALGLRADQGAGAVQDLCEQLAGRRSVLILDGCERHVEAAAHLVVAVLGSCPGMTVVVTSTEPLHLPGETLHRLAPLATSGSQMPDAVALFLDRAAALRPELADDPSAREAIAAICRRLDGLPLAVEIAAARVSALHPSEILAGLDGGFRMLQVKDPTRPARQRGLEALLEWNFGLLADDERRALEQLSLLAASFDLDAARVAVAPVGEPQGDLTETGDLVWSLVDKSLLVADPSAGGTRYRSFETVRSYARGRLRERGAVTSCAVRLAKHYEDVLGPSHGTHLTWVHAAGLEIDNVRSVLAALGTTDTTADEQARLAQTLACTLARFHAAVQSLRIGIAEVGALTARWPQPTSARAGLLTALGDLLVRSGEPAGALAMAVEADAVRQQAGAPAWDEVGVEKLRGEIALATDRPEQAAEIADRALGRALGARGRARMWNMLGIARATSGDLAGAATAFRGELAAAAEEGDDVLLAHAHSNAAEVALRTGDLGVAARHQRTCLEIATALGQTGMLAYGLLATARIGTGSDGAASTEWADAVELVAKAESLLAQTGLTLYQTDSKVIENFLLEAREQLGQSRYHRHVLAGRSLPLDVALRSATAVLDAMSGGRGRTQLSTRRSER